MKIKSLFGKVKSFFSRSKSEIDSAQPVKSQNETSDWEKRLAKEIKLQRFFYRNTGLNRQERNRLLGELRSATGARRKMIKQILKESPKNIPYRRGQKIHPQHTGLATPENLILT